MRAEKKLNESADTCHANRSCIHSRSTCCNGGSEGQREEVRSCRCYQAQRAPHTTCSYHVTHLAHTELHRNLTNGNISNPTCNCAPCDFAQFRFRKEVPFWNIISKGEGRKPGQFPCSIVPRKWRLVRLTLAKEILETTVCYLVKKQGELR